MVRIAEFALFTADVPKLVEFYERVLGVGPRSRSESHAYFDVGGTTIFIHLATDEEFQDAPTGDHVSFAVPDPEALSGDLRASGSDVVGPKEFYWGRSAYVRDPDGRLVELTKE
ncbi:MAG TPA: VOC family protein [Gaiellaceae bacterium]|nr:VOC family protein [Gaiellaceae bacterium]